MSVRADWNTPDDAQPEILTQLLHLYNTTRRINGFKTLSFLTPTGDLLVPVPSSMHRKLISSGSPFESEIAYSRAVVQGDWIFVSGTTGFDYATMSISDRIEAQCEQCLKNIEAALAQAGASLHDIVRIRYILPNGDDFSKCWPTLRRYFGESRPAATMISARLLDPRMLIEIEATALRSDGGSA